MDTLLSPPTPFPSVTDRLIKRRSKSLDDLSSKRNTLHVKVDLRSKHDRNRLNDSSMPASPVISFDWTSSTIHAAELPRRRHSSCIEPSTKECMRLATIYGWVTESNGYRHDDMHSRENNVAVQFPSMKHKQQQRRLHTSRSFTQGTAPANKLTKILSRRRKSLILPAPRKDSLATVCGDEQETTKGIMSAIIDAANRPDDQHSLGWVGVEETKRDADPETDAPPPPPPPIENDPHIFDLLQTDPNRFINYSKRESNQGALSSATVEKLVEKLTKEMDSEFMMDFFLTYRQFLTRIKLCKLLILRFRWALLQDTDERRLVRIRTFVVLRHWLTHYWPQDFATSRTLRFMLCTFLSQLRTHPIILASPRDARIIKNLRSVLKRQRKLYNEKLSESAIDSRQLSIECGTSSNRSTPTTAFSSLPRSTRSIRKDSAVGMSTNSQQSPYRELKPSVSTPTLAFFARSRRISGGSQRGVNEGNAWAAKMNFGIKTIKRSVPSMCHSIWQGMHHPSNHEYAEPKGNCLCKDHPQLTTTTMQPATPSPDTNSKRLRKISASSHLLMKSASRRLMSDFNRACQKRDQHEQQQPITSSSTPVPIRSSSRSNSFRKKNDTRHPNPLCPFHWVPRTPAQTPPPASTFGYWIRRSADIDTTSLDPDDHSGSLSQPFVLRYRSEVIARHFCIIEQQMLQNVSWNELAELRWRNRRCSTVVADADEQVPEDAAASLSLQKDGVNRVINYFNMTCQWVTSEIVQARLLETRIMVIEKYIRIALKCYHHRNYSTLMQILLGLQSPAVSRLKRTWQRIDSYEMRILNELQELAKPFHNWKNVREAMSKAIENVAESSAVESVLTSNQTDLRELGCVRGCIPFLGLYLSDLVFNAELPTFIAAGSANSASDNSRGYVDDDEALRSRLSTHFVNYNKFRVTASVIKHVLAFQLLSQAYVFDDIQPELLKQMQTLRYLDNADIRRASLLCEE